MTWSLKHIEELKAKGTIAGYTEHRALSTCEPKKHKFGAVKKEVDGIVFDSIREANRYQELKLLERGGLITELQLQVPYELNEGGTHSLKYIADFVYRDGLSGAKVIEDAKGFKTKEYRKKRRLMKKIYGITIKEI